MYIATKHRLRSLLIGSAGLFLLVSLLPADPGPPAGTSVLALVGGRVLTQSDVGAVEGTVLVRDGLIAAVGRDVALPAGATRLDVTGCVVTPGLIDARSTLWLATAEAREGASDGGLDVVDG